MHLQPISIRFRLLALGAATAVLVGVPLAGYAELDKATADEIEAYFDFSDYNNGTIMAQQIPAEDYGKFYIVDVRNADQYAENHIPGATNIEWPKVFASRTLLPRDKTILVYCNTGSFSGQVAMALRMAGYENVRILHGGINEWHARGGLEAYARAVKQSN